MEGSWKTLTHQPAQPSVRCGEATAASAHFGDRKVPMCPACTVRFDDYLVENTERHCRVALARSH